jgi:phosphoglycerol transferase
MLNKIKNTPWQEVLLYAVALLLTAWIMERLLKLRHSNLFVPYGYSADALIYSYIVKAIVTKGWFWTNDSLSMPGVMYFQDYPYPDNIQFLLIKVIGWFTGDYAATLNIFYLLTFPLTTICTLYVLRRFGISYGPAVLASLLYNFSCYHFGRGIHHLMYSTYYMVPLMVMVFLWIMSGELQLKPAAGSPEARRSHRRKMIAAIAICLFVGSTGCAYYPFFALMLLPIVGLVMVFRQKSIRTFALPAIFAALIISALVLNITPTLLYRQQNGDVDLARRYPSESEEYALKITHILLPISEHRLLGLSRFRSKYDNGTPHNNENRMAALGFIGSAGFLVLLGWLFFYRRSHSTGDSTSANVNRSAGSLLDNLSVLNCWCVLVGTMGGIGTLFAYLITPQIRSYNRVSIYIAFFSLLAVALLLDVLSRRYFQTRLKKGIFYGLIVFFIFFGVLDQTNRSAAFDYEGLKTAYQHDREYFRQIESVMPENAMIFQLPIFTFPEDYIVHIRGYLHSDRLRWSFGAMSNRPIYLWQKDIESKPVAEMLQDLAIVGFNGIYLDRATPKPIPPKLEEQISAILSQKPLVSRDGTMAFYSMLDYRKKIREGMSEDELAKRGQASLHPLRLFWRRDFSQLEGTPENNWHWSGPNGELHIENGLDHARKATIEMSINSPNAGTMQIESSILSETFKVSGVHTTINKTVIVPPGKQIIKFICDAPPAYNPTDLRSFVFRINNFKFTEIELDENHNGT